MSVNNNLKQFKIVFGLSLIAFASLYTFRRYKAHTSKILQPNTEILAQVPAQLLTQLYRLAGD